MDDDGIHDMLWLTAKLEFAVETVEPILKQDSALPTPSLSMFSFSMFSLTCL